jgi:hypothetical protein
MPWKKNPDKIGALIEWLALSPVNSASVTQSVYPQDLV